MSNTQAQELQRLRVDKWLWAARFFKTRSLAKTAIEGGKVQLDGQRVKVSKEISVGRLPAHSPRVGREGSCR